MNTNVEATTPEKNPVVADQGASVAPEKAAAKKTASSKKAAPKGQKPSKGGKTKPTTKKPAPAAKKAAKTPATKEAGAMRPESKGAKVLALISRAKGATLAEIMKATDWQAHSVRGFISGALGKKLGIKVTSAKNDAGERSYSLAR